MINGSFYIFSPTLKFYFEKYETKRYKNNCPSIASLLFL
ncbi:hypothetical protein HMPREF0554_1435 [Pseudoleptotrichia goodfellowii F0264]|uniref:Uncharacterized protein n=1 Tax=Pseudoleptotrichia goodfellowii F0264 TaxID=596323 RepID=D0GNG5_9FUSO|nr:hypothetical protein HMPREF0554_1435 [Pseudoleptotrichia goodfellowii F0264]